MRKEQTSHKNEHNTLMCFPLEPVFTRDKRRLPNFMDVAVTNVVSHYFLIVSIGYVLYTITSCYLGTLNGIGKPTKSMILMIFYYIIIRIPFAYLLSWLAENLNGVWIAILISHIVACIITILTSNQIIKRLYGKLYDRTKKARYKSIESNCCGKF